MTQAPRTHSLTIGDLAERTGVPPATLRSWESRYGFPAPARLDGGHRRYAESDVDRVREVQRQRERGLALEAAVRLATSDPHGARSVYAELRRQHPEVASQPLSKSSLLALSRAIEDECCALAEQPLLVGAFQRQAFLHASYPRWRELARTARATVVFADLSAPRAPRHGQPVEVALPESSPLHREWLVVCDAPDLPACLAAVERPGQEGVEEAGRLFDAVWTVDPRLVRLASRVAVGLADEYHPGWRPEPLAGLDDEPPPASADLRRAAGLLNRTMGYLDAR